MDSVTHAEASFSRFREETPSGYIVRRRFAFTVPLVLVTFLSGGLIFGTAPFQEAIVQHFDYTTSDAQAVVGRGLQVFVFGSAILAPLIDFVGPRRCALAGLLLESLSLLVISLIRHISSGLLSVALGSMGVGGNLLLYASAHFPLLFKSHDEAIHSYDGLLQGLISGAYMVTGFAFILLQYIDFETFFRVYTVMAAVGACLAGLTYPDTPYSSMHEAPQWCQPCEWLAKGEVVPSGRDVLGSILNLRTWLFFLSFGLTATCANWGLTIFIGVVSGTSAESAALVSWMPLIANSTFIFSPIFGYWIDSKGFTGPIVSLGLWTVIFALSIGFLPLRGQWFTLLALNILQSQIYSLQFMYLNKCYPGTVFGVLMSLSCITQSAVGPLALLWQDTERRCGAAVFSSVAAVVCALWAFEQWRQARHDQRQLLSETTEASTTVMSDNNSEVDASSASLFSPRREPGSMPCAEVIPASSSSWSCSRSQSSSSRINSHPPEQGANTAASVV